jgi:hypothetical protein
MEAAGRTIEPIRRQAEKRERGHPADIGAPQIARHLAEVFRQQGASLTPAAGADNYDSLLAPLALPVLPPLGDGPGGRQRLGAWLLPAPARRSPSAAIAWRPDDG